jgi:hypothetical protein
LIVALTVAALLPPAIASIQYLRDLGRPTTSEQAYRWLPANAPPRARIIVERYGVMPATSTFRVDHVLDATRLDYDELRRDKDVHVVLGGRALGAPQRDPGAHAAYRKPTESELEMARFVPQDRTLGPTLVIVKLR